MVNSIRLITAGMVLLLSIYFANARSVDKNPKGDCWKRKVYHLKVDFIEKEDEDHNSVTDHTVSEPPGPSSTTSRPVDWQPDVCDIWPVDSLSFPEMEIKADFNPGPPFTEKEIQDALLAKIVTNDTIKIPCSTIFPHNESSSRGVINPNWPNAEIPYEIDNALTPVQRQVVIKAMEEIKNRTCITFPPKNKHINWMRILHSTASTCRASNLGAGWTPPVKVLLNPEFCFNHGTLLHEILHVAGLAHEQSRADRDQYVTILWENIIEKHYGNFCKRKTIPTGHLYDYASIMHYEEYTFSKEYGVLKTIDTKGNTIGQLQHMSQGDVDQLNYIYCNYTFECETGWQQIGNTTKRYCFVPFATNWFDAYARCQRYGAEAQLAILDTESKRSDVATYMKTKFWPEFRFGWIGANNFSGSGSYKWLNGNPVKSESWYINRYPQPPSENRCAITSIYGAPSTLWDGICHGSDKVMLFICEK